MKHVELSKSDGGNKRFRVWCSHRRNYVLDDANAEEVKEYFTTIAVRRALSVVDDLLEDACTHGLASRKGGVALQH